MRRKRGAGMSEIVVVTAAGGPEVLAVDDTAHS
jgi:hypothetical protein